MNKNASKSSRRRRNRRKLANLFPEPRFQLRYLSFVLGASLFPICITGFVIWYFVRQNYMLLVEFAALESQVVSVLQWELRLLIGVICVTFFLFLVGITIFSVMFSHRVAGVIFALKRAMKDIASGKRSDLNFRQKDEFKEVADLFNQMVAAIKKGTTAKKAS